MTEVIIYTLDIFTLLILFISIPPLLAVCEFVWYLVKDRWVKRDYELVNKMNKELKEYQERKWEIEEDYKLRDGLND